MKIAFYLSILTVLLSSVGFAKSNETLGIKVTAREAESFYYFSELEKIDPNQFLSTTERDALLHNSDFMGKMAQDSDTYLMMIRAMNASQAVPVLMHSFLVLTHNYTHDYDAFLEQAKHFSEFGFDEEESLELAKKIVQIFDPAIKALQKVGITPHKERLWVFSNREIDLKSIQQDPEMESAFRLFFPESIFDIQRTESFPIGKNIALPPKFANGKVLLRVIAKEEFETQVHDTLKQMAHEIYNYRKSNQQASGFWNMMFASRYQGRTKAQIEADRAGNAYHHAFRALSRDLGISLKHRRAILNEMMLLQMTTLYELEAGITRTRNIVVATVAAPAFIYGAFAFAAGTAAAFGLSSEASIALSQTFLRNFLVLGVTQSGIQAAMYNHYYGTGFMNEFVNALPVGVLQSVYLFSGLSFAGNAFGLFNLAWLKYAPNFANSQMLNLRNLLVVAGPLTAIDKILDEFSDGYDTWSFANMTKSESGAQETAEVKALRARASEHYINAAMILAYSFVGWKPSMKNIPGPVKPPKAGEPVVEVEGAAIPMGPATTPASDMH